MGNVEFDDTYLDIIAAAKIDISRGVDSTVRKKYLDILQKISNGKVTLHEDRFYLKPGTQAKLEFNLVAEGLRKIALLWQLIKNGTLERGTVLFWDEPVANINPSNISTIAKILLALQSDGVQIFVATHDYFLPKYIEVYKNKSNDVMFHSLYFDESINVSLNLPIIRTSVDHGTAFNIAYKNENINTESYLNAIKEAVNLSKK